MLILERHSGYDFFFDVQNQIIHFPFCITNSYMPRIMAVDYGLKRTGLAVTDAMQIIATGLTTVESAAIFTYLRDYFKREQVELIIVGEPKNQNLTDTHASEPVRKFVVQLKQEFPSLPVKMVDERFTSKMASRAMIDMGMNKKDRRNKAVVDEIAATILLQGYLQSIQR